MTFSYVGFGLWGSGLKTSFGAQSSGLIGLRVKGIGFRVRV